MKYFIASLALLASADAWAQQTVTRLQCDGKYSSYVDKVQDAPTKGGFVEIRKDAVKLLAFPVFNAPDGSTYRVSNETEASICFQLPDDKKFSGCLNRFSGVLTLTKWNASNSKKIDYLYTGECRLAKPLF